MGSGKSKPAKTQKHAIQPLPRPGIEPSREQPIPNPTTPPPSSVIPRDGFSHSSKLRRPQDQLRIRPSWLHQSNINERYKHVEPVGTLDHDDEYLHRRRIAINRWQNDDPDAETTNKSKSFFDEYIHP